MLENRKNLMEYRLNNAKEKLGAARILLDDAKYKDSINRSYYAMFSAVRALLALDNIDFSKHASVIAYFQKEYIKTGVFGKEYSKYISRGFQIRNNSDYTDFFLVSKKDAEEQYNNAVQLVQTIEQYVKKDKK